MKFSVPCFRRVTQHQTRGQGACFLVVTVDQENLCDGRNEVDIRGWTEVWSEFLDEFKRCACFLLSEQRAKSVR